MIPRRTRFRKNRHGNIGSGTQFDVATYRSHTRNAIQSITEMIRRGKTVEDENDKPSAASCNAVVSRRQVPKSSAAPTKSTLRIFSVEKMLLQLISVEDAAGSLSSFAGITKNSTSSAKQPMGTLNMRVSSHIEPWLRHLYTYLIRNIHLQWPLIVIAPPIRGATMRDRAIDDVTKAEYIGHSVEGTNSKKYNVTIA